MNARLQMPQRTLTVVALAGLLLLTVAAYARGMNGDFEVVSISGRLSQACDLLRRPAAAPLPQVKAALADCPEP